MGRDKALVEIDGEPMVMRVARALGDDVIAVGGDEEALRALGLRFVPDAYPGAGPLGGIITALRAGGDLDLVVTAPCDMPWITAEHVRSFAVHDADVAVAAGQHLFAAWRPSALPLLEAAFDAGERSPKRALQSLRVEVVTFPDGPWARDVDSSADL